ncbi:UBX domain-containing protein 1 [Grifola frondosa]|uniref:UBX domain-containing protein 1 n=1 Tax=Grifola frondosa TaxID=5627 RepID=A0A1C7MAD6_GRIFR|nr:UBX domain-containing protein 1 [Grifola frondosa]
MADDNDDGARTLGGSGPNQPRARPTDSGPRIGRIGGWNSSSSSRSGSGGRRIATLRDIGNTGAPAGGHEHAHGGSDDEDEEDDNPGADQGESCQAASSLRISSYSGISVQNPDRPGAVPGGNLVRDLLRRAAEAGPAPAGEPVRSRAFFGGGHTLGSDEVESTYIPDPDAPSAPEEETAIRHLTFWRDGFSVEDGELMRYDDPRNEEILAEINSGRAPPSILNVSPGQPVELRVVKRLQDDWIPSPKAREATIFSGVGHRLGSPVPGARPELSSGSGSGMPGSFPGASAAPALKREPESISTRFAVDQSQPTTSVQIRLADGTRMVCRMNLTHTVRDIRDFINASRPENSARPYTIGTTFPNRTLDDDTQTIQAAGLLNSVIVQRWV